jgi:integrase
MLAASVVPAVYKAYLGAWSLWVAFAEHHGVSSNTPDTEAFEYYLLQEAHLSASVFVVDKLAAAAVFFTASANFKSPFEGPNGARMRQVLKGIRKTFAVPSIPKKPLTREDIMAMLEVASAPNASFSLKRAITITALCFQQLLRVSEVVAIRGNDVSFDTLKLAFMFTVRKAKIHSSGFAFTAPVDFGLWHCVGNYLQTYLAGTGFRLGDELSHFACKATRKASRIWCVNNNVGISTDTACVEFKDAVCAIGLNHELYSTHSAKRGAATEAVKAGNTDAMVTIAGRWKSPSMVAAYVRDNEGVHAGIVATFST